jgi:hypothetical protein
VDLILYTVFEGNKGFPLQSFFTDHQSEAGFLKKGGSPLQRGGGLGIEMFKVEEGLYNVHQLMRLLPPSALALFGKCKLLR